MDQEQTEFHFTTAIKAPVSQVFQSFTNAASVVEWLCYDAKIQKKKGRRDPDSFYFWWMDGYHVFGMFSEFQKNKSLSFSWQGSNEPQASKVSVEFIEEGDTVRVNLVHSGLGTDTEWDQSKKEIDKGWKTSLNNLKSMLETGFDMRYKNQPMLGVYVGDSITPEMAAEENLPVDCGIKITGTVPKMGAEKIGLKAEDILALLDGRKLCGHSDITAVVSQHKAGDSVSLVYFRGDEKLENMLEFSTKPEPKFKPTALGFSEQMDRYYKKVNEKLEIVLEDAADEEADFIPSAGAWSVKEVLAHLIAEERYHQTWAVSWVMRDLNHAYPATNSHYLNMIVRCYPTVPALLQELKRIQKENVSYFSELPQEFVDRKHSYIKLASNLPEDLLHHSKDHINQLKDLIAAARSI